MNDIFIAPLRDSDKRIFLDTDKEQWTLLFGRLTSEDKIQCIVKNEIEIFSLSGNITPTKGYDLIILGRIHEDFQHIYVLQCWEPAFCSPYLYDLSSPIPFVYFDLKQTTIEEGKKKVIFAGEQKKKNGATKDFINVTVKYRNSNLPPIFILKDLKISEVAFHKTIANGIQLGAPF